MIKVKDLMIAKPCNLNAGETIQTAQTLFSSTSYTAIPIINRQGKFLGILEEKNILQDGIDSSLQVESVMNKPELVLVENESISSIQLEKLKQQTIVPVTDSTGRLSGIIGDPIIMFHGYSVIKDGLLKLKDDESKDIQGYGIVLINKSGQIIYFNKVAEKIFGVEARDVFYRHINKVIKSSGLCHVLKSGQPEFGCRVDIECSSLRVNRFPVWRDGEVVAAISVITPDNRTGFSPGVHHSVKSRLEILRLLETMNDGVMMLDKTGEVIKTNSALERVLGIEANNLLGFKIKEIPGMEKVASIVADEMLNKLECPQFVEQLNGQELLIFGNYLLDSAGRISKLILTFKNLSQLNTLAARLQPTIQRMAPNLFAANRGQFFNDEQGIPVVEGMVAAGDALVSIINTAVRVAKVDSTVLISGETGVGKELMAQIIHKNSNRSEKPFIKLNCGALPEHLIESEIFGYEPGAFTGADKNGKRGLIEMADGGTLFLDEIGELPLNLQVKFLRALQEKEVQRIGGVKSKKVDFRLIAATNRNLAEMAQRNEFRPDLFYRINVVPIDVPPLRDRKEDIVPLVLFFLRKFTDKYGMTKRFSPEVIRSMVEYNWPGNIRELENTVERLVVTCDSNLISPEDLRGNTKVADTGGDPNIVLRGYLEETEKQVIVEAVRHCKTTRQMANALGISQSAVVKKMKKYGISKSNAAKKPSDQQKD